MATQLDRLRGYVGNLGTKTPADVATTANITLSGEQTIDGITTTESRVLVKNQTNQTQNGIYISSTGPWVRAADADGDYDLEAGTVIAVGRGTVNAGQIFIQQTVDPVIGTSNLVFANMSTYLAGVNITSGTISGVAITNSTISGTEINLQGVVGIGTEGVAAALLLEGVDATYRGIAVNNTQLISWSNSVFTIEHNMDGNFNRRIADGSTWVYISGEDFNVYSYPTGTAGTALTGSTRFRLFPQCMSIGAGTIRVPPANEYQISVFGHTWMQGATSETAGQVFTLSQGSYKTSAGAFIHAFNAEEASQLVLRDGTVVMKCSPAGTGGTTVVFTDILVASPTAVTINGNLNITGTVTAGTLNSSEIDYIQLGTGAVATSVQTKLRETFSVVDFGADKTGVADSATAIRNAIIAAAAARAAGAIRVGVLFPVGKYKTSLPIPLIASVQLFCDTIYGATIDFSGSAANVMFSATLSGTTFTTTVGLGFGTQASGAAARNLFILAESARCTVTSYLVEMNNAAEMNFENVYAYTNIANIGGFYLGHCVSARFINCRADKATLAGGTAMYFTGQTNATTILTPQIKGNWGTGIIAGGVGNKIIGGVIESSPTVGIRVLGEKISIDGTWLEGITAQDIILGDTGATAYATDIRNVLHGGGATNAFYVLEGTFFHYDKSNRQQTGTAAYTNKFESAASAALSNGTIQVYGDPNTFTVTSINLGGKGAINVEVFGSNSTADNTRYGMFSSASGLAIIAPLRSALAFTPAIAFGGASTGVTYSANGQVGYYWTTGKVVHFTLRLALSNKGSATGAATITGLPVASLNQVNLRHTFEVETTEVDINIAGGYYKVTTSLPENSTAIALREAGDAVAATTLTEVDFTNTSVINITGSYLIA